MADCVKSTPRRITEMGDLLRYQPSFQDLLQVELGFLVANYS
jgi:hypothetical protein